jgi:nucleoside-diphosphate-sugar epimerase
VVLLKRSVSNTRRIADLLPELATYDVDRQPLSLAFEHHAIDCLLHCATDYGRKATSTNSIIEANLRLPLALLELAVEHAVPSFVNTDTLLNKRVNFYSLSKRQFREWLSEFSTSILAINVAIEHFFGPGDDQTKFVSAMIDRMLRGDRSIDLTAGEQLRDFIFIDDVVEAFVRLIEHHVVQRAPAMSDGRNRLLHYEVGSGRPVSIREFMSLLRDLSERTDLSLNFGALPYRQNETMHSVADIAPLRTLGWSPQTELEEGLRRTLEAEKRQREGKRLCGA